MKKKFNVTCPFCNNQEERTFNLNIGGLNRLSFVCSNCNAKTESEPFEIPKNWKEEHKKKIEKINNKIYGKKRKENPKNLNLPRIGKVKSKHQIQSR